MDMPVEAWRQAALKRHSRRAFASRKAEPQSLDRIEGVCTSSDRSLQVGARAHGVRGTWELLDGLDVARYRVQVGSQKPPTMVARGHHTCKAQVANKDFL